MLGENGKPPREVMAIESNAQYIEPGVLVFAKGGALVGQSFDATTGRVSGEPFAIAESVRFFLSTSAADFYVAERIAGVPTISRQSIAAGVVRPYRPRDRDG